jgi:ubiquitin-like 1-activating enzyme E1 A
MRFWSGTETPSRDRTAPKEIPKNVKATASYPPLHTALLHRWTGLSKRQTKEVKPAIIFTILGAREIFRVLYMLFTKSTFKAIWEYQSSHQGNLPNDIQHAGELQTVANTLLANADVNKQVITTMPQDLIECVYCISFWVVSRYQLISHLAPQNDIGDCCA